MKCLNVFNKKCSKKCRNLTASNIHKLIELGFAGAHKLTSELKICDSCRIQLSKTTGSLLLHDLPVELLEHILSYLPLTDRKAASLVCHQWNELAFNRCALRNVVFVLDTDRDRSQCQYLRASSRRYRNVSCKGCGCIYDFKTFIEAFGLLGADLESFCSMTEFTEKQLCNILTLAPNLRQLHAGVNSWILNRESTNFPVLSNLRDLGSGCNMLRMRGLKVPNLEQLSVNFNVESDAIESLPTLQRLAPQLKSVELQSMGNFIPIEELQFPRVEVLQSSGRFFEGSASAYRKCFAGFKCLKEVTLDYAIDDPVLDVITTSSPGIEKLHFSSRELSPNSFHLLERLKRLKELSIIGGNASWITTEEYKPLTSVKRLSLRMYDQSWAPCVFKSLRQLLPNVTHILSTYGRGLLHLCVNFPHLQRLSVENGPCSSLHEALSHLDRLEELTFCLTRGVISSLAPSSRLMRLKLEDDSRIVDADLLRLPKIYPNLRYLEVLRCDQVTASGVGKVRARLKRCVVHYDPTGRKPFDFIPYFFEKPLK